MDSLLTKAIAGLLTVMIAVGLLLALCQIGPLLSLVFAWVEIVRRRRSGETMPWEEAASRVERGWGCIVVNQSGVAGNGRIWWSPESADDEGDQHDAITPSRAVLTDVLFPRRGFVNAQKARIVVLHHGVCSP